MAVSRQRQQIAQLARAAGTTTSSTLKSGVSSDACCQRSRDDRSDREEDGDDPDHHPDPEARQPDLARPAAVACARIGVGDGGALPELPEVETVRRGLARGDDPSAVRSPPGGDRSRGYRARSRGSAHELRRHSAAVAPNALPFIETPF